MYELTVFRTVRLRFNTGGTQYHEQTNKPPVKKLGLIFTGTSQFAKKYVTCTEVRSELG